MGSQASKDGTVAEEPFERTSAHVFKELEGDVVRAVEVVASHVSPHCCPQTALLSDHCDARIVSVFLALTEAI
jgi:hypothetical protein